MTTFCVICDRCGGVVHDWHALRLMHCARYEVGGGGCGGKLRRATQVEEAAYRMGGQRAVWELRRGS